MMDERDHAAYKWMQENPDDPRVPKIMAKLRAKAGQDPTEATKNNEARKAIGASGLGPGVSDEQAQSGLPVAGKVGMDVGLPAAGQVIGGRFGGPPGAMAGGALGNVLAGFLGRKMEGQPTSLSNVGIDAAWGAAPGAIQKVAGGMAARRGAMKTAGYLAGEPTADIAASSGVDMSKVPASEMQYIMNPQTAGGSQLAGQESANAMKSAARGNAPAPQVSGMLWDGASAMEKYAKSPSTLSGFVSSYLGRFGRIAGKITSADPAESRYISAAAQAAKRGLPLSPELKAAIENMPGQQSTPAMAQAIRDYFQRGSDGGTQ